MARQNVHEDCGAIWVRDLGAADGAGHVTASAAPSIWRGPRGSRLVGQGCADERFRALLFGASVSPLDDLHFGGVEPSPAGPRLVGTVVPFGP